MTFAEYLQAVRRTAASDLSQRDAMLNAALGLGESGEAQDAIKKWAFHGHSMDAEHLLKELGDQLFYITWIADLLGFSLEEVAVRNVLKLQARYPHGFDPERSRNREGER